MRFAIACKAFLFRPALVSKDTTSSLLCSDAMKSKYAMSNGSPPCSKQFWSSRTIFGYSDRVFFALTAQADSRLLSGIRGDLSVENHGVFGEKLARPNERSANFLSHVIRSHLMRPFPFPKMTFKWACNPADHSLLLFVREREIRN
jgi:hypothetical protein